MIIKDIIIDGTNKLKEKAIEDAQIKSRIVLQYILKQDKNFLVINSDKEVDKHDENLYYKYIQEIIKGKPIQYITKNQEFMGLEFYVDENVLIPQPDTEILVEEAMVEIERKIESNKTVKVLDLCTGSGAIAISIEKHFTGIKDNITLEVYGLDISEEALKVAEKNAVFNNVQIKWIHSDMFGKLRTNLNEYFDVIISNPPYIKTDIIKTLEKEVREEPIIALDGGNDGLDFYRIIAQEGNSYLRKKGSILLEIGYDQKKEVTEIFKDTQLYKNISCIKDLSGNDRVIKMELI